MTTSGKIRAGMGGWTFEPWDTSFYPDKLSKAKQLNYASRQVPTIEVNGTYYSTFKPPTFAKWASEAPDGFVFSLKGNPLRHQPPRAGRGRRVRAALPRVGRRRSSATSSGRSSGSSRRPKNSTPDDFGAFLKLLPEKQDGVKLRHAVEVRHRQFFAVPEFVALCRKHNVAIVYADHDKYPAIADVTGDFVYARLQTGTDDVRPATSRRRSTSGPRGRSSGRRARRRTICPAPTRERRAGQAARRVRLLHHVGQGARAAWRHGVHGARAATITLTHDGCRSILVDLDATGMPAGSSRLPILLARCQQPVPLLHGVVWLSMRIWKTK